MATLRHDVRHRRGDSFVSKTYAVLINGAPVDLDDGWVIKAQARRSFEDTALIHEWLSDQVVFGQATFERDGAEITTDWVRLETLGADTADWPIVVGEWDLQISKDGDVYTIVEGSFRVTRDVTR